MMSAPKIDYSWVCHLTENMRRWQGIRTRMTNTMLGFVIGVVLGSGRADAFDHLDALDSILRLKENQTSARVRRVVYRYLLDHDFVAKPDKHEKQRGGTAIPGGILPAQDRTLPLFDDGEGNHAEGA